MIAVLSAACRRLLKSFPIHNSIKKINGAFLKDSDCYKVIGVIIAIVIVIICLPLIIQANAPHYQEQVSEVTNAIIPGFDPGTTLAVFGGILAFSYLYYRRRAGQ